MRIAECGLRRADCGGRIAEGGLRRADCGGRIAEGGGRWAVGGGGDWEMGRENGAGDLGGVCVNGGVVF
jgi:hypothetical protein